MLRVLSDRRFHSGEDIAKMLDVSRASLSNAAKSMASCGIELDRIRGRGYRLNREFEWLDRDSVLGMMDEKGGQFDIEIRDSIDSTSSELLRTNAPHGRVLAAELQTDGRGRMGRAWLAEPGRSLTFSAAWKFDRGAGSLSGLGLATGLALVRAMKACGIDDVELKWPNDLLHRHRKLAGILIELKGDMLGPSHVVIGIGINFSLSDRMKESIDQAVTCIDSLPFMNPGRNRLFAAILSELRTVLETFGSEGFSPFREEWSECHAYHSKQVRLRLPSGKIAEGLVCGVNENGEILLDTGLSFSSGEVSLRGKN
ncbi:MAG TPA: biotin--[acetyl-CoA-carboxylase] ligase [Burkholderiales bacterium]|nr:biotin--[acetyl-CoA-carboxylase] ligase [Burkholderiales bacterium]